MGFKWMRYGRTLASIRQWAGQLHQLFLNVYIVVRRFGCFAFEVLGSQLHCAPQVDLD